MPDLATETEKVALARLVWDAFCNIEVDDDMELQEGFLDFGPGRDVEEVWGWFEDVFGVSTEDLMNGEESMTREEIIDRHILEAGCNQARRRGSAPEKKPKTWEEIEAYAEWIGAIRTREALIGLKEELTS